MTGDLDAIDDVLAALAEPMRREVLDRLASHGETTATALATELPVSRQAIVQHLSVLDRVGLATGHRSGRERRYRVQPQQLVAAAGWMTHVAATWDAQLAAIQRLTESAAPDTGDRSYRSEGEMTASPSLVYVTYVATSPETLWNALTDPDRTAEYWDHRNVSDWRPGSSWEHRRLDSARTVDISGVVVESAPPRRLVHTWAFPKGPRRQSRVAFDIEPVGEVVRLTVTHQGLEDGAEREGTAAGWSRVLSNLKSLLETGRCLPGLW
jgi:uncharacterized protein YndB with AHSA1/START domain/DNA-binding transcriptional ArsR family regulator